MINEPLTAQERANLQAAVQRTLDAAAQGEWTTPENGWLRRYELTLQAAEARTAELERQVAELREMLTATRQSWQAAANRP